MCEEIIIIASRLMLKSVTVCLVIDMSYHMRTVFIYTQLEIILYIWACFLVNIIACLSCVMCLLLLYAIVISLYMSPQGN